MKILIATAFPTQGAGSGALITTQAKSYIEDGHQVVIITANNRTNFDKLEGVRYHLVPFKGESENPEVIEGQLPFNYLMFTTHTESTQNFWNVGLEQIEQYTEAYKKALQKEMKDFDPDVIHAQHNWLLSSTCTEMGKPVVTTIHGTDLMGYERSKKELDDAKKLVEDFTKDAGESKCVFTSEQLAKIKKIYEQNPPLAQLRKETEEIVNSLETEDKKEEAKKVIQAFDNERKYSFFISEAEKSAKNSDEIIVISEAQKIKFNSLFPYAAEKVHCLENGYDPKVFYIEKDVDKKVIFSQLKSDRAPDGVIDTNYDYMTLFVGKFADFKGIDSILTAAKIYEDEFEKQGKKALTVIVGSGALDAKLRAQADQLKLKNTHFVGRQGHELIRKLQNLCIVSLIPSRDEPFGLVVIEGTSCGHPVIGSNSGGIPGILNTKKEKLPNDDIILTKLGLLIKALPDRPNELNQEQKDKLDVLTTDYVVAGDKKQEAEDKVVEAFPEVAKEVLSAYLKDYDASTNALARSVLDIAAKKYEFDNKFIADYTLENYSQPVIRDKLIRVFKDAKRAFSKKK